MKYRLVDTSLTGEVRIYRDKLIVGILRQKSWNQEAYGEFLGTMLRFRRKGFLGQEVGLWDIEGRRELGQISLKKGGKRFTVHYDEKDYEGALSTTTNEWVVDDLVDETTFRCPSEMVTESILEQNYMHPAVVLATLYIRKQYRTYRYMTNVAGLLLALIIGGIIAISLF